MSRTHCALGEIIFIPEFSQNAMSASPRMRTYGCRLRANSGHSQKLNDHAAIVAVRFMRQPSRPGATRPPTDQKKVPFVMRLTLNHDACD